MSESIHVVREKRSKSSSGGNKSFVKNVTSKVSGLLPSTITKWFSRPPNTNGSAALADSTDSSTEDESQDAQPAPKRMRYNSPAKNTHFTPVLTKTSSTNTELIEPFNTSPSPIAKSNFRKEPNLSKRLQSNINDNLSEKETHNTNTYKFLNPSSTPNTSIDRKRKSLFDVSDLDRTSRERKVESSPIKRHSEPYFKPGLLCPPFYSGRTSGGAAGLFMNQPNIRRRNNTSVKEVSNNSCVNISHSAQRIMDILENYSSPLGEARRLPQVTGLDNSSQNLLRNNTGSNMTSNSYKFQELNVPRYASIIRLKQKRRLMDTTNVARQIIASHSSSADYIPYSMTVPSATQKKIESDKYTTQIIDPVVLPTISLQIDQDNLPKFSLHKSVQPITTTTSIKTVSKLVHNITPKEISISNNKRIMNDTIEYKNINNDSKKQYTFASPVKVSIEPLTDISKSKFSFGSPERNVDLGGNPQNQVGVIVSPTLGIQKKKDVDCLAFSALKEAKTPKDTRSANFKNDSMDKCSFCNATVQKRNSECLSCEKKTNNIKDTYSNKPTYSDKWKCEDCWVENDKSADKCICCGGIKSNFVDQSNKSTAKWKCGDCWAENDTCANKCACCGGLNSNKSKDEWKCCDCWVLNDDTADKCICCGKKKPDNNNQIAVSSDIQYITASGWKCDECWIENKNNLNKCAACGSAKPGVKSVQSDSNFHTVSTRNASADSNFQNIREAQACMWECSVCLTKNEKQRSICVCCEVGKRDSKKEPEKNLFSFNNSSDVVFKFGINPEEYSTEGSMEKKSKAGEHLTKGSEANNNILPKTSSFTFGILSNKTELEKPVVHGKADGKDNCEPAFTFGMSTKLPTNKTVEAAKPPFEVLPKQINENIKKLEQTIEKPNDSPKSKSTKPILALQTSVTQFTIPSTSQNVDNSVPLKSVATVADKTTSKNNVETNVPKTTFTFTPGTISVSKNLFATPATEVSDSNKAFSSLQRNTTTSASIFDKTKSVNTDPISLFQNNDSTLATLPFTNSSPTTTAAFQPKTTSTESMFSFGKSKSSAPETDKQKFNFNFGNNKSGTTLFKSAFGSSSVDNKFNPPSTSTIDTANTSTTNALGGSNESSKTNVIPTNALPGVNGLGSSNQLGGSAVPSTLTTGTTLSTNCFTSPIQKENIWTPNNAGSSNLFSSNTNNNNATNVTQNTATFTFGASTAPFNSISTNTTTFGTTSQSNLFGLSTQNTNNQPSLFSNPVQNPAASNLFGASTPSSSTPSLGLFGSANISSIPGFNVPSTTIAAFDANASGSATPTSFNFGAKPTSGLFGFSQQPPAQQAQQPQTGIYNFGGSTSSNAAQVQFSMGSAAGTTRRVRKAVRRTPQR